jgi:selenocysteine lyase/cysteine desulfurase
MKNIRSFFSVTERYHYFQSAGMSPIPVPVLEKMTEGYISLAEHGDIFWNDDMKLQQKMFEKIAGMVHCNANDIAFLDNNSMVMSLLGLAFKQKGQKFNIVSMEEEFPSNSVPFEYLGIEMRYVQHQHHRYSLQSVLELCTDETLAVVTSYVQYCTGFRQDLMRLGTALKERNILFIVNATQAFPFFPLDMQAMNIDVLSCSVHKWGLCGHIGTLFITSSEFRKKYPSPVAGWLSVDVSKYTDFIHTAKNKPFTLWETAQQYNFGSANLKARLVLDTALDFLEPYGWDNLRNHLFEMTDYLIERFNSLNVDIISPHETTDERSAIVSFSLRNGKNKELVEYLEKNKVIVSLRNNYVRVSVNVFTNKEDMDVLYQMVKEF